MREKKSPSPPSPKPSTVFALASDSIEKIKCFIIKLKLKNIVLIVLTECLLHIIVWLGKTHIKKMFFLAVLPLRV